MLGSAGGRSHPDRRPLLSCFPGDTQPRLGLKRPQSKYNAIFWEPDLELRSLRPLPRSKTTATSGPSLPVPSRASESLRVRIS